MGSASTKKNVNFALKLTHGSHDTIHTFKNYFTTMFSIISFQFLAISGIQIDPKFRRKKKFFPNISVMSVLLKLKILR